MNNVNSHHYYNGTYTTFYFPSLLYIIVAETIACAIKKDQNIDGFRLTNSENVKIFQYADDTSVIVHSYHALFSPCSSDMNLRPVQNLMSRRAMVCFSGHGNIRMIYRFSWTGPVRPSLFWDVR